MAINPRKRNQIKRTVNFMNKTGPQRQSRMPGATMRGRRLVDPEPRSTATRRIAKNNPTFNKVRGRTADAARRNFTGYNRRRGN